MELGPAILGPDMHGRSPPTAFLLLVRPSDPKSAGSFRRDQREQPDDSVVVNVLLSTGEGTFIHKNDAVVNQPLSVPSTNICSEQTAYLSAR